MPAVTIDASVVDGGSTKLWPNPITPINTPFVIESELISAINSPINISSITSGDIGAPVNISPKTITPINTPVAITANALDPEVPPFALNHARILYENLLEGSGVSVTTGTNGSFTLIPNTAQRWVFSNGAEIIYTIPANTNIDTVCIGAHNLKGYSVGIEYDTTTNGSFVPFTDGQMPINNNSIMFHIGTSVNARRIKVVCSGSGDSFIGSVYAGIALQMQRPFFVGHTPTVLARQADYYSSMSESGNFIGVEVRRRALESGASWANLSDNWYRTYFVPFLDSAEMLPFYFAWNLLEHSTDVAYCKNITNVAPSYSGTRDLMTVDIPLVGIA